MSQPIELWGLDSLTPHNANQTTLFNFTIQDIANASFHHYRLNQFHNVHVDTSSMGALFNSTSLFATTPLLPVCWDEDGLYPRSYLGDSPNKQSPRYLNRKGDRYNLLSAPCRCGKSGIETKNFTEAIPWSAEENTAFFSTFYGVCNFPHIFRTYWPHQVFISKCTLYNQWVSRMSYRKQQGWGIALANGII